MEVEHCRRKRVQARRHMANSLPDPHEFFQLALCLVSARNLILFGEAQASLLVG